jgi:hypothetical protein
MFRFLFLLLTTGNILGSVAAHAQPQCPVDVEIRESLDPNCTPTGRRIKVYCEGRLLTSLCKAQRKTNPNTTRGYDSGDAP